MTTRAMDRPGSLWTHIEAPDETDRRGLADAGLPAELVEHALDGDEVPRVDRDGGHHLVVLRVLAESRDSPAARLRTVPLGVLITGDRVYTITRGPTDIAEQALRLMVAGVRRPADVMVAIIAAMAEQYLDAVRRVDRVVEDLEDGLATSQRNDEVLRLLEQQKTLVRLATALRANRLVTDRLTTDAHLGLDGEARERLDDALVELHQAIEMVTVSTDILSQMMDAFASIISNNLNVVMKFLTSLTIVLTGPMLVASLYGMNVPLPGATHPWAFVGLLALSMSIAIAVAWWFSRRQWL